MRTRSGGNFSTLLATMRAISCPWIGPQTSQPSAVTAAVQFIGSSAACAWNGEPYSRTIGSFAAAIAAAALPLLTVTFQGPLSSAVRYWVSTLAELTAAFGPSANVTSSLSSAVLACQKCSATTPTPFG